MKAQGASSSKMGIDVVVAGVDWFVIVVDGVVRV